ncbi:MAG: hypothetical protein DRH44_03040 [Candidatus Coatesbacteria bacterium]|nr:MAG: hypothetical protein DRH44_03040 [Candidatus Coatesbacteria bacterium]
MKCRYCGFENPEAMRYCGNCGMKLVDEKGGEIKNVTVLFADISGFTTIAKKLDAEETREMLNTVFEVVSRACEKYGGTIDKFIGDEALVLFGAPISTENHIERAIRTAIEINQVISEMKGVFPVNVRMHMGIHSGKVVIGEVGGEGVRDYTVIGDTVNLASRLRDLAPPGQIFISEETAKRAEAFVEMEFIKRTTIKGIQEKVNVFRVLGLKRKRGKVRGIEQLQAPMIGRKEEMKRLTYILRTVTDEKKMRVVFIEGDAGIGKSRLYNEFISAAGGVKVFQSRFLPFAQEPDFPLKTLLRQYFNLKEFMTMEDASACVERGLKGLQNLPPDAKEIVLGFLFYEKYSKDDDFETYRQEVLSIAEKILRSEAKRVLIIGVEDIHWADVISLNSFEHLIKFLVDTPIMFIFMSRPTFEVPTVSRWKNSIMNSVISEKIDLLPLTDEDSAKFISKLLEIERLPLSVKNKILKKGGGNPLFIEELLKTLMEKGYIYLEDGKYLAKPDIMQFEVPDTIGDIVLSRVDNLNSKNKRVIQTASIIGDVFWDRPLDFLLSMDTSDALEFLIVRDFISERAQSSFENANEYSFKHVLLQESIYESILNKVRKKSHREFARWLLRNYPDKERQFASLLAYHFEKGEEFEEAVKYYKLSGDLYSEQSAPQKAIESYNKALFYIKKLDICKDIQWEVYDRLGVQFRYIGMMRDALEAFRNAISYADDACNIARVKYDNACALQEMSRYDEAIELLHEALVYGEGDIRLKMDVYQELLWVYYLKGDIERSQQNVEQLKELIERYGDVLSGDEVERRWAGLYDRSGILKGHRGDIAGAIEELKKSLEIYKKQNNINKVAVIYNNIATYYGYQGRLSDELSMLKRSLEIDEKIGRRLGIAVTYYNIGLCYLFLNDLEKAEDYFNKYLALNKLIDNKLGDGYGYRGLAGVYLQRGNLKKALDYVDQSIKIFSSLGSTYLENVTKLLKASILISDNRAGKARNIIKQVDEYAKKADNPTVWGELFFVRGKQAYISGKLEECEKYLDKAEVAFLGMNDICILGDLYIERIKLYEKKKDMKSLTVYKDKLEEWVKKILEGIDDYELKSRFLEKRELQGLI